MSTLDQFRKIFLEECGVLLGGLEANLADSYGGNRERLHAALKTLRTIKAGAAAFNKKQLLEFAGAFEAAVEALLSAGLSGTPDNLGLFMHAADVLAELITAAQGKEELSSQAGKDVLAELTRFSGPIADEDLSVPLPPINVHLEQINALVSDLDNLLLTVAVLSASAHGLPADGRATLLHNLESIAGHAHEIQRRVAAIWMRPFLPVLEVMPRLAHEISLSLERPTGDVGNPAHLVPFEADIRRLGVGPEISVSEPPLDGIDISRSDS